MENLQQLGVAMSDVRKPHPLDDDETEIEIEFGRAREPERALTHQPLLKLGLWVVVVSFVILFISAVVTSAAPPNSSLESAGSAINSWSGFALLIGFSCILVAYRLPHVKPQAQYVGQFVRVGANYQILVGANVLGYFAIVVLSIWPVLVPSLQPLFVFLFLVFAPVSIGLLVTVAIWHTGYLRAYAVGVLSALFFLLFAVPLIVVLAFNLGIRPISVGILYTAVLLGAVLLSGLVCAGYVNLLAALRHKKV